MSSTVAPHAPYRFGRSATYSRLIRPSKAVLLDVWSFPRVAVMAKRNYKPEDIVWKLWQANVLIAQDTKIPNVVCLRSA